MKAIFVFTCFLLALNVYVEAATCEIEGWKDENYGTFTFKVPINDTFRGIVRTFKTKNIFRMKLQEVKYLNATWEDQTLTFFTSDNYKNYEKENAYTNNPYITLKIDCLCAKDSSQTMTFRLPILDNNNYFPVPSKKSYNYIFGLTIPNDYAITKILPITATDYDITNSKLTFSLEKNDFFKVELVGKKITSKEFQTTLTAKQEITAPFNKTFELVIKDDGYPQKNTSVPITIVVSTPKELEKNQIVNKEELQIKQEDMVHPPVFEKHVYFADYSSNNDFNLEEPIVIKYGAESNTQLKQKGFETYYKVQFEDSTHERVTVNKLMSLPKEFIQSTNIITMEIEAVNQGLNLPGRTALLIRLPNIARNVSSVDSSKQCEFTIYAANSTTLPLILFLLAVFCIVFINIYVAIMFVSRSKMQFRRA